MRYRVNYRTIIFFSVKLYYVRFHKNVNSDTAFALSLFSGAAVSSSSSKTTTIAVGTDYPYCEGISLYDIKEKKLNHLYNAGKTLKL